jgi:ferredoxin
VVADPLFLAYLAQFDDDAWLRAVDRLTGAMHPVDRAATRAWFHFFPLRLQRALDESREPAPLERHLRLQGRWRLGDQRHSSHWFLFGHRYWPDVVAVVQQASGGEMVPGSLDLAAMVQSIARDVASRCAVEVSWVVGISAVALRTLQQVGLPAEEMPAAPVTGDRGDTPDAIVARRRGRRAGWIDRLRGGPRRWAITFDERSPARTFPLIDSQHLTTAAALDTRDYRTEDARCSEGPIPVHCRSCSCGTCWVGVIGGAEHLSPVDDRERTTIAALGYLQTTEPRPVIRLSCMAQAHGPVSLVVPPWNGQVGVRLDRVRAGIE